MKDTVEIKKDKIIAQLSFILEKKENSYVGYIPSFDIPFTSPSLDKASQIAKGLVNALFVMWLKKGRINLVIEKLEKFKFYTDSTQFKYHFEHDSPIKTTQRIQEELHVI